MGIPQDDGVKEGVKPNSKNANVMFAKLLAGNDKKIRDKGLKKLKKWLTIRSLGTYEFTEDELMTIWTGLFYSMWMSDMPLVQEDLAESLSSLIHCFNKNDNATVLFIKCFNATISKSWASLDQYRVDKFSMLVRRFLRQSLTWLANGKWDVSLVQKIMAVYEEEVLDDRVVLGFKLHFIEIFLEELAKISEGKLTTDVVIAILKPFIRAAALTKEGRVRFQLSEFFRYLIKQTDVALDYEAKFGAWQKAGFPGGDLDLVVTDSEDEEDDKFMESHQEVNVNSKERQTLDPRAGSVHVALPQIILPIKSIRKLLKRHSNLPDSPVKSKRLIIALLRHFKTLQKGKYPYAVRKINIEEKMNMKKEVEKAAKRHLKEEAKNRKGRLMLKKLNKKGQRETTASNDDGDENPEKVVSMEKSKRKRKQSKKTILSDNSTTDKKAKKRRTSSSFDVSDVEVDENKSPVGTKKLDNSDSPPELDLPCGWIVEACEKKNSESKTIAPDNWNVKSSKTSIIEKEVDIEKASKKDKLTAKTSQSCENEVSNNETPTGKISKKKSTRLSILNQSDLNESAADIISTPPAGSGKKVHKKSLRLSASEQVESTESIDETNLNTPAGSGKSVDKTPLPSDDTRNTETEIIISKKKSPPAFFAKAALKAGIVAKTPTPLKKAKIELEQTLTKSGRRIMFVLDRNMAQEKSEYFEQIERSPQIPFDSAKQPKQSALKAGLPPSPINPFYARRLNLNISNPN